MKVGILTFHKAYNFGANLQALTMQEALRAQGATPTLINYQDSAKIRVYSEIVPKEQARAHEAFFERYYQETVPLYNSSEIAEYCSEELDAVIVGSDAVLSVDVKYDPFSILQRLKRRQKPFCKDEKPLSPYWLNWNAKNGRRPIVKAAVAASAMGSLYFLLPKTTKKKIQRAINDFEHVYVRDRWTGRMLKSVSGGDSQRTIENCPDPVFALNSHVNIEDDERPLVDTSDMVLIAGRFHPHWVAELRRLLNQRGLKLATLPNPDIQYPYDVDINIPLPLSPLQWYQLIANAAGFVGIRFHALVSSIANATPCVCIDNLTTSLVLKRSSKTFDLCCRAGIKQCYYNKMNIKFCSPASVVKKLFSFGLAEIGTTWAKQAKQRFDNTLADVLRSVDQSDPGQ